MEVFHEQVLSYLKENNTTIDEMLDTYNEVEEVEKKPDASYIREVERMSDEEKYYQMKSEQQLNLLLHYKSMVPNGDVYLTPKYINQAIQMTQKMKEMMGQQ